jgi:hypothetical protein
MCDQNGNNIRMIVIVIILISILFVFYLYCECFIVSNMSFVCLSFSKSILNALFRRALS